MDGRANPLINRLVVGGSAGVVVIVIVTVDVVVAVDVVFVV